MDALAIEPDAGSLSDATPRAPLGRLGLALVVLAVVHLFGPTVAWVGRLRSTSLWVRELDDLPRAIGASDPVEPALVLWPLALALLLAISRRRELLLAVALAFLALAVDGLLGLAARFWTGGQGGLIRPPLGRSIDPMALAAAVAITVLDVVAAWQAWAWRRRIPGPDPGDRDAVRRMPAILGRMTLLLSVIFLGGLGAGQGWMLLEEAMLRNPNLRRLFATPLRPGPRRPPTPAELAAAKAREQLNEAMGLNARGEHAEARRVYFAAVRTFEDVVDDDPEGRQFISSRSLGLNNLAWLLATCPVESLRDPASAVTLSRRALDLVPQDGNTWNTLAVALYREGRVDESRQAFDQSMSLRGGGDAHDWYFLAMIEHDAGREDVAKDWFEKARDWRRTRSPRDEELVRFEVEAAERLGLPHEPDPPTEADESPDPLAPEPMIPGRRSLPGLLDPPLDR